MSYCVVLWYLVYLAVVPVVLLAYDVLVWRVVLQSTSVHTHSPLHQVALDTHSTLPMGMYYPVYL